MKELKVVEILSRIKKTPQDIFRYSDRDFDDALSELRAHKAKIEEMKEHFGAKLAQNITTSDADIYADILQKLEELK